MTLFFGRSFFLRLGLDVVGFKFGAKGGEGLLELGELEGDEDGQGGDEGGVDEEGEEAGAFGEIGLNPVVDQLFDKFVPGQGGDDAEAGSGQGAHLFDDDEREFFGVFGWGDFGHGRIITGRRNG